MRHRRPWKSAVFRHLLAVLEGMLWMALGGLLLALLIWRTGSPSAVFMRLLAGMLWCAGAFLAGRRAGMHGRHHGIRTGMICGGMLILVLLSGMAILHEQWQTALLFRMAMMLLSGAVGGVIGVNTRLRKPPD